MKNKITQYISIIILMLTFIWLFSAYQLFNDNKTIEDVGQEIFDLIVRVASGEKSKSETQGLGDLEFVPWQIGATM